MGIDGEKGVVANMKEQEILEPFAVKVTWCLVRDCSCCDLVVQYILL